MISQRLGFIFDPVGAGELRADPSARQRQLGVQQIARRADTGPENSTATWTATMP
jgi:hypothetical protein